ncbi:MAG: DUF4043 family protein [Pseudomonadota bacterium]
MALQQTAADLILQKFRKKDYQQYNRQHRYAKHVGKDPFSIIQREDSLMEGGEFVNIAFTDALGETNKGEQVLDGNEATFGQRKMTLKPYWHREGVKIKKSTAKRAFTDQYKIQRRELKTWMKNHVYQAIINAMDAVAIDEAAYSEGDADDATGNAHPQQVTYAEATAAQRNTFVTNNGARRLLFGGATSKLAAGDMAASLANVAAADVLSPAFLNRMKRMARTDTWGINGKLPMRPMGEEDQSKGREFFKVWVGPQNFEELGDNEDMKRYNTDARIRGVEDNPLFQDGDLLYKGMILCEEPRMPLYAGVGASGIDVEPIWFCGAQSLGWAMGQKYRYTKSDNTDYQFLRGIGVEEQWSIEKLFDGGEVRGMITGYAAAVR